MLQNTENYRRPDTNTIHNRPERRNHILVYANFKLGNVKDGGDDSGDQTIIQKSKNKLPKKFCVIFFFFIFIMVSYSSSKFITYK